MRKFLITIISIACFSSIVFAEGMEDFTAVDSAWDGQKTITNQEYEQVIEALEEKKSVKEKKQRKKLFKRFGGGTSLHNDMKPDNDISEIQPLKPKDEGILVNVPVNLIIGNNVLERGYYKVYGERDENKKIYISFYQSQFLKAKIEVIETQDDYNEENIDFARIIPYNDSFVKMIFGSIDFNAYTYIPFSDKN